MNSPLSAFQELARSRPRHNDGPFAPANGTNPIEERNGVRVRTCRTCGQTKELEKDFYPFRKGPEKIIKGWHPDCKKCANDKDNLKQRSRKGKTEDTDRTKENGVHHHMDRGGQFQSRLARIGERLKNAGITNAAGINGLDNQQLEIIVGAKDIQLARTASQKEPYLLEYVFPDRAPTIGVVGTTLVVEGVVEAVAEADTWRCATIRGVDYRVRVPYWSGDQWELYRKGNTLRIEGTIRMIHGEKMLRADVTERLFGILEDFPTESNVGTGEDELPQSLEGNDFFPPPTVASLEDIVAFAYLVVEEDKKVKTALEALEEGRKVQEDAVREVAQLEADYAQAMFERDENTRRLADQIKGGN